MPALLLIPFLFGYVLSARVLREKQLLMRLALSYGLGLFLYLFIVNALFHFFPLRDAVYATLALMAAGSLAMLVRKPVPRQACSMTAREALLLGFLCVTAFLQTWLWQMRYSDDDFWIHAPLMALYLKDNFPPMNPFFPDLGYRGHYGRDLTIASLSVLLHGKFLLAQYVVTALNQVAIILIGYLAGKRYLKSYPQALCAVVFAFLGVNGDKTGLLEVFKNNNSFAYLLLFLNAYLYFLSITRRDFGSKIVALFAFAVYGVVYETHYVILLASVALCPFVISVLRRRWRLRYFTITALIILSSFVIALAQGGALTDVARRYVAGSADRGIRSEDIRGASQEVQISFPKKDFLITSWRGDRFSLFSGQLLREAGIFVAFLPFGIALMAYRRNYWGILFGLFSLVAILVPAAVDFGRFNTESLRFLFFGGMAAAMVFGISAAMAAEAASRKRWIDKRALALLSACVLAVSLEKGAEKGVKVFRDAATQPETFFFSPEQWACGLAGDQYDERRGRICQPIDVEAALKMAPLVKKGDVMMTNLYSPSHNATLNANSVLSAFSGAYITGMGIKFSKNLGFTMGDSFIKQAGYRALAFWNTIDMDLLPEMKVTYLYVDPDNMPAPLYKKLRGESRLELVEREKDPTSLEVREVYKVKGAPPEGTFPVPRDLHLKSVKMPPGLEAERFYRIAVALTSRDRHFGGRIKMFYRVTYRGRRVNLNDEIKQTLTLERRGLDGFTGSLYFATPYEEGNYELELYVQDGDGYRPLLGEDDKKALVPFHVVP